MWAGASGRRGPPVTGAQRVDIDSAFVPWGAANHAAVEYRETSMGSWLGAGGVDAGESRLKLEGDSPELGRAGRASVRRDTGGAPFHPKEGKNPCG
jgi:hypothetical protein